MKTIFQVVTARSRYREKRIPNWPLELNGKGESNKGNAILRFPKGDIFLSYITAIHELGHIGQIQRNPSLAGDSFQKLMAREQDAWKRGWSRFLRANPRSITDLEDSFQEYRAQGKLKDFSSFHALYHWVQYNVLKLVRAQRILFRRKGRDEEKFANIFEGREFVQFLATYRSAYVGEMVITQKLKRELHKAIRNM